MKQLALPAAVTLFLGACASQGDSVKDPSLQATDPTLSMWEVSTRRGVFQVNSQYDDVKVVVTKIQDDRGAVLYDFKKISGLGRFTGMFSQSRQFSQGRYSVIANCIRNAVDITNADNPNAILMTFRFDVTLERDVFVDLIPSPTAAPYSVNGYQGLSCKLTPTGVNRVTRAQVPVEYQWRPDLR